jgi:phospholipid transport system substrate-binding protein
VTTMMQKIAIAFLILSVCSVSAFADEQPLLDPEVLVKETMGKITHVLRAEQDNIKNNSEYLLKIVDEIVASHFDFARMSSWVLGKYWRKATADEKIHFSREFRTLLVRTYAKALNDNYDKEIVMLASRKKKGGKIVIVRTEVQLAAGFPIPINYKMHVKEGVWKIYDVSVDGISLVANYRSSFSKEVRKDGVGALIARLASRNAPAAK